MLLEKCLIVEEYWIIDIKLNSWLRSGLSVSRPHDLTCILQPSLQVVARRKLGCRPGREMGIRWQPVAWLVRTEL